MATARINPPPAGEDAGQLSRARLAVALTVLFLALAGGGVLAAWCVALDRAYEQGRDPAAPAAVITPTEGPAGEGPALITLPPEQQAEVNAAVVRGVRYLKTTQADSGTWAAGGLPPTGCAALPGLTLLECGVPPGDPNVQKAAEYVRKAAPGLSMTYELSLAVLFLDRLGDPRDEEHIRTLALRLVAGQTATGGWGYECPVLPPPAQKQLASLLADAEGRPEARLAPLAGPALLPEVQNLPVARDLRSLKPESFRSFVGDNSNSQFAVLALWVARRHAVPLERTATLVVARYRGSQEASGRWLYTPGQVFSPSPTCAGLLGLAVGQGVAVEKGGPTLPPDQDPAVQKALGYLGGEIGRLANRRKGEPVPMADLYFLWSLERVAVLHGLKTIDGRDWYGWAKEVLLANQQPKGNWQGGRYPSANPLPDTCFALLTLLQANLAKDLTSKLQLLGGPGR
jgi:hypothetical protein